MWIEIALLCCQFFIAIQCQSRFANCVTRWSSSRSQLHQHGPPIAGCLCIYVGFAKGDDFSSCQPYFFFISPNNNTFPPFGPRTIYGLVLGEYKIYAKFNNMMYSMFVFFSISRPPAVWRAQKHVHFARFGAKNGGKNAAWMHFVPFVLDVFLLTLGHVEKSGQRKKKKRENAGSCNSWWRKGKSS